MKDNRTLMRAISFNDPILPVVSLAIDYREQKWFGWQALGPHREQFLQASISDLSNQLSKLGGELWVTEQSMSQSLTKILESYPKVRVIFPKRLGQYEQHEEHELAMCCKTNNIEYECIWDWTLIDNVILDHLPFGFSGFRKKIEKNMMVTPSTSAPQSIPFEPHSFVSQTLNATMTNTPVLGGETAAHNHLNDYIWESKAIKHYKQTRNKLIGHHVSSKFSAYLSQGCLSPRQIFHNVKLFEKKQGKNTSTYWLIFELLWRDFFQFQYLKNADQWFEFGGIQQKSWDPPKYDHESCHAWASGTTSNEFVNANMIELRETGYMSNRGRQNVASYLIFDLQQDWRFGAAVFEHFLIDYDVASNIGNWMYIAGVGNSRTERVFNVQGQQKRYDPNNEFLHYWLNYK